MTPDASIDGSRDAVSGGEVKDKVITSSGKLSRNIDGITEVSIDRGSLVSIGGVDLVVGSITVLNAVLGGGGELGVNLRDNAGGDGPRGRSSDTNADEIGSGLEGEGTIARDEIKDASSGTAVGSRGNKVGTLELTGGTSDKIKVDKGRDETSSSGDLNAKDVGEESINIIVVGLNVGGSDLKGVLEVTDIAGIKGVGLRGSKRKGNRVISKEDVEVVRGTGVVVVVIKVEIKVGVVNRDKVCSGKELAVRLLKVAVLVHSSDRAGELIVEASLNVGVLVVVLTNISSGISVIKKEDLDGGTIVGGLGEIDDERVGALEISVRDLKGVKVVLLSTKAVLSTSNRDGEGKGDVGGLGLIDVADAETEGEDRLVSSKVADGDVILLDSLTAALGGNEAIVSVAILGRSAAVEVTVEGVGERVSLDKDLSGSSEELGLDDDAVEFNSLLIKIDVEDKGSESLRLGGVRLDGESVCDSSVGISVEIGGSDRSRVGLSAGVADTPLDIIRKTSKGGGADGLFNRDDSDPPVSVVVGLSNVASPDASNAALSKVRRVSVGRDRSTSSDPTQAAVVVGIIVASTRGTTSGLCSIVDGGSDVSGVVGGEGKSAEAALVDAVSTLRRGVETTLEGSKAARVRSSGELGPDVNIKGDRRTSIVDNVVKEDLKNFSILSVSEGSIIKTNKLDPSVGLVSTKVGDVGNVSIVEINVGGSIVEGNVLILGGISRTLEVDEDVIGGLEASGDSLNGDIVATGTGETERNLPATRATSTKTRGADLGGLALIGVVSRVLISPVDVEGSVTNIVDLNNDVETAVVVSLRDIDLVVDVSLVRDELVALGVFLKAVADDVGLNKRGCDVIDLDGVSDGSLIERRVGGGVFKTNNRDIVDAVGELARGNDNLAPVVGEVIVRGRVSGSAGVDRVIARAEASKSVKVVIDLDGSVLDVVDEDGDVISKGSIINGQRIVLNLANLDVSSERLITAKRSDGALKGGSEGELDRGVKELVSSSKDRDVITSSSELTGLDLPCARGLGLATESIEVVKAGGISSTGVLVDKGDDVVEVIISEGIVGENVAVGVKLDDEISVADSNRNLNEKVLVTLVRDVTLSGDSRNELGVRDIRNGGRDGVSSVEDGIKVALDGDKVIVIGPLASGDDDGLVAGRLDVGRSVVIKAAISSNASAVHKDVKSVTKVVVLLKELAILDVGELDDEIVVGDGLGSNLVVGVLVGAVPLGDLIGDELTGNEGLDDGGLVDGGSEGVSDGGRVLDKVLVDTEDRDVPDTTAEVASRDKDGAARADNLGVREEVGLSAGNLSSARRSGGTSAVVKVVIAGAVSGKEVVVDKGLDGLGNTMLDVGDLNREVRSLDNAVSTDVIVVVLTLVDELAVRNGALDREGDVKVSVKRVVDGDLVIGGVSIGGVSDVVAVNGEVKRTLFEFAGLDHEGARLTREGSVNKVNGRSGADLDSTDVSSETVKVGTIVALASRERTVEHGKDDLGVLLLDVKLDKEPGVDGGRNVDDVKVVEGLSDVLVDGDSSNESLGDGILNPGGTDGVGDGETVKVVNEEGSIDVGDRDGDVPGSGTKVASLNHDVASVIGAAGGVGDVAALKTSSAGIGLVVLTLVDPDVNKAVADVVDLDKEVRVSSNDLGGGNLELVVGLGLGGNETLVGGVAIECGGKLGNENGKDGEIEVCGIVLAVADGEFDADVPRSVAHLAGVDGDVAGELTTVSDDLFKGGASARNAILGVDGVIKGRLSGGNRGVNASLVNAASIVRVKDATVVGGDGDVLVKETDGCSWGRNTRDVDEEISSLSAEVLGDLNRVKGIVVDAGLGGRENALGVKDNEGLSVVEFDDLNGALAEGEGILVDADGSSRNGDVIGSFLELTAQLDDARSTVAPVIKVVGSGELTEGVDDVVVVVELLFEVVELRVNDEKASKIASSLGRLGEGDAEPVTNSDVVEGFDAVVVIVARENAAGDLVSVAVSNAHGLGRGESGCDFCRDERKRSDQQQQHQGQSCHSFVRVGSERRTRALSLVLCVVGLARREKKRVPQRRCKGAFYLRDFFRFGRRFIEVEGDWDVAFTDAILVARRPISEGHQKKRKASQSCPFLSRLFLSTSQRNLGVWLFCLLSCDRDLSQKRPPQLITRTRLSDPRVGGDAWSSH